ncbi:MAG: hypothetical protein ACE5GE_14175 [Phycisphaerae bacterium]
MTQTSGPLNSLQIYGFYDIGAVWDGGRPGASNRESLASAGIGLRAGVFGRLSGGIEFAKPLTRDVAAEDGEGRVFVTLSGTF